MNLQLTHVHGRCREDDIEPARCRLSKVPSRRELTEAPRSVPHVAIACTLRSGSNLLCEMLRVNGFGNPKEWFQLGCAPSAGAAEAPATTDTRLLNFQTQEFLLDHEPESWRGVKWDWRQFQRVRRLAPSLPQAAAILQAFHMGKWFLLLRRDLSAQAVSLYAARQTNVWMGEETRDYRRLRKDFDGIYERFADLCAEQFAWENQFSAGHPIPLRLFYEDLVTGDRDIWLQVMRHLDPAFDAAHLNLKPLQGRPHEYKQVKDLKTWFRQQIMAGRQPRSVLWLLESIGRTVSRVEGQMPTDGPLARLAGSMIGSPIGFRIQKLDLRKDVDRAGAAKLVQGSEFLDREALRLDPPATCSFHVNGVTRILLQFHAHSWSGIAEISLGEHKEEIDLFTQRTDTRHVFRDFSTNFSGTITIRCTGAKNIMSKAAEVWLHRILILTTD